MPGRRRIAAASVAASAPAPDRGAVEVTPAVIPPRIVRNARPGVDWNTCGQAAIATLLAHARLGPFAPGVALTDAQAIDWVGREFPADLPFGLGTSAHRIAHALRTYGLGVERVHSGWFGRNTAPVLERVAAHVALGHPVPVCVDAGMLGGAAGSAHWAIAVAVTDGHVRLGNTGLVEPVSLPRFLELWRCRLLPYGHNHAAILGWF